LCGSNPYSHYRGSLKIPRRSEVLKGKISLGKYEPKLEFPDGWGVQTKKVSVGAVWIFSGTTHRQFFNIPIEYN